MFDINEETIKSLSRLSRIEITAEELPSLHQTLKQVIGYFDQLNEVDLSSLSPYSHVEEQGVGSLRADTVGTLLTREDFLANAPEQIGGMVKVPPILKQH